MFQRPWKIWLLFGLCLAIILPAMVWLTIKAIQLEESRHVVMRENEQARREAEIQELVSSALWRMDWMLTPLVGQEASRSHLDYDAIAGMPSKGVDYSNPKVWADVVSPIVVQPSEFVKLHFQVSEDDIWSSPQSLPDFLHEAALQNGIASDSINANTRRMQELSQSFSNRDLLELLPTELLPEDLLAGNSSNPSPLANPGTFNQLDSPDNQTNNFFLPNNYEQQVEAYNNDANAANGEEYALQQIQQGEFVQQSNPGPQVASRMQRNSADFLNRASVSQQMTQSYAVGNLPQRKLPKNELVREGVSRPVWLKDKLLLARRTIRNDRVYIQGCWFDWERIREALKLQIADLLPGADLVPLQPDSRDATGRALATLPIALDMTNVALPSQGSQTSVKATDWFSPIRISLIVAWSCMFLGTIAVAVLLQGVVKLSERRASFVSAVTHELRTPLTTFRMYAEMLAKGMVKSPEKQQKYCDTLQVEADRLSHLVENVLQFARLEHGKRETNFESLQASDLVDRFEMRFRDRIEQAGMKLDVQLEPSAEECRFTSDSAAIEHILFNLIDNACKYAVAAKDKTISLRIAADHGRIKFSVNDHGPGIAPDQARRIFRPFSKSAKDAAHSAPGVGLGLALCQRLAKQLGGRLTMSSSDRGSDTGSTFTLSLPLGDN